MSGPCRSAALIILDGWGVADRNASNAIALAHTPNYDEVCRRYPFAELAASGSSVGLSSGAPSNPEAGHRTIAAGRAVRDHAARLNDAIASGEFSANKTLLTAMRRLGPGSRLHLVGLLSDGGIHSTPEQLYALIRMAKREGISDVEVHCILDGRDVPPRTADIYLEALEIKLADIGLGRVASLCGRHFGMDDSERWERTARAFTLLAHCEGDRFNDPVEAVRASFLRGISEEFLAPVVIGEPAPVRDGDLVVFFGHRADSQRQLVHSLSGNDGMPRHWDIVSLAEHGPLADCAFPPEAESNVLADVLEANRIGDHRFAETSRWPHVTDLFNLAAEARHDLEVHHLVRARPDKPFDRPESESFRIADRVIEQMSGREASVFVVNIAAAGLAAAAGDLNRAVEAIQYVDTCLGGILEKAHETDMAALITASHGGCESIAEHSGSAHDHPVPLHLVLPETGARLREGGSLQDVAPTLLGVLGLPPPPEMTGRDLRLP